MKVAIVTLPGHFNYGNRLQNYALQEFISNYAEIVETLWFGKNEWDNPFAYLPELKRNKFDKIYFKNFLKYILNWKGARKKEKNYGKDCIRQYNIKKFSDKYINIKYDYKIDERLNDIYDYFIVGSDQIWFLSMDFSYIRFLRFAKIDKRIAYAPSFGISKLPNKNINKNKLKQFFNEMKSISIREKAGANILYNLIGKDVPVLVDPTILLSKEKWQKLELKPKWYNGEKYILTYFLGNPSLIIENLAKKNDWKIYNLMDSNNLDLYVSKVEEFLFLIHHAELVVTDSFHGTVFSILMNTPFLVVNRQQKGVADMTSRIDTLIELFGYQDRYIVNGECNLSDEEILYMDFNNVKVIQEREIKRSTAYLKKALNLE
ncbi:polysaccharide pyruvyl transferase family protein [Megamonas hypermegale]|uniref:polysaccharide pyruvyl transferase family protein n=1 Tax=Megamonas hypermegale TaxID=158847 RepID=UPI00195943ED|nr:polysaccharide pyruvyl transferase family protein [Megamonas hypermegale]MBM6834299.1 polysaccharide pyruvyl transferase family protein [Megamonas hypermegale]